MNCLDGLVTSGIPRMASSASPDNLPTAQSTLVKSDRSIGVTPYGTSPAEVSKIGGGLTAREMAA
jgi:hypothetical protein